MGEYDSEPVLGLPEALPEGETILWQGAPDWKGLAVRALHVRLVAVYFGLLLAWEMARPMAAGVSFADAAAEASSLLIPAAVVFGLIALYARLLARTTVYTITNRRIVLRFGVALPRTMNLPFAVIEAAALKVHRDGTGDIPVALTEKVRLAFLHLWPHVRPWRIKRSEPMLRSIPEARRVADLLSEALRREKETPSL